MPLRGRDADIDALGRLVLSHPGRIVTVTGAGGIGKTCLAVAAATAIAGRFKDGAAFAPLSGLRDPAMMVDEVARCLGIALIRDTEPLNRLCEALRHRDMVLVLDNFEQIIEAASAVATLADSCPNLRVLVTSRRGLHVPGEWQYVVAGLEPEAAAQLFADRAQAVKPDFAMDASTRRMVDAICARLQHLPLAIELAAARIPLLPPATLHSRIADAGGVHLLADHDQSAANRQRSVVAAVEWSHDLLSKPARTLLRRLGVFSAGFDLVDAEAVCVDADLQPAELFDALSELVDMHLVDPAPPADPPRFALSYPVRSYAAEQLAQAAETEPFQQAHAEHYLQEMRAAAKGLEGPEEHRWTERIDRDIAELRIALGWLRSAGRVDDALLGASALGPYWLNRGLNSEGRRHLEPVRGAALDATEARAAGWRIRLAVDGVDAVARADTLDHAIDELEAVQAAMDCCGELTDWLRACEHLSYGLRLRGRVDEAQRVCAAALARCSDTEIWWRAEFLHRDALLAIQSGDPTFGDDEVLAVVDAAQRSGNQRIQARALQIYALVSERFSGPQARRDALMEVRSISERIGDRRGLSTTLALLAVASGECGDDRAEVRLFGETIALARDIGYWTAAALALMGIAEAAARHGHHRAAMRLHSVVQRHQELLRGQAMPGHVDAYAATIARTEAALGVTAADESLARGAALSDTDALNEALRLAQTIVAPEPPKPPPSRATPQQLTAREREVLAQIATGRTNEEIGRALHLSPKTVMHHCGHIYQKLGVRGRAEAVAHAVTHGLLDL
ncbi:hypothetical protein ASJ79_18875 [Mycobacterium sp. NAZ190054]|nr:hypothetical protein ASJ79_18875 [Mycobacterium sp. NAZ190054]